MALKWRSKLKSGQGLVEFALVIPLLLLLLVGMAEFARIFAIYSNLANAAREGTRYGMVYPTDEEGIKNAARQKVSLVNVADVDFPVRWDSGPPLFDDRDAASLRDGDRVVVEALHDIQPMLPFLRPLLLGLRVHTRAARTIARLGGLPTAVPGPPAPRATVIKTAFPSSVPETGGDVTFTFTVNNTGEEDVTLTSLSDPFFGGSLDGQGDCALGGQIPAGSSYSCEVVAEDLSSPDLADHTNTVTAVLDDDHGGTVTAVDSATVTFTDVEVFITLSKTASPGSVPETGANVTFAFLVQNERDQAITLASLNDSAFGDLNGQGTCVTGGTIPTYESYSCSVTRLVSGIGMSQHTNRAIAVAEDTAGNTDAAEATATVLFTLSAAPLGIYEPLEEGDFTVTGSGQPGQTVTLRDLQDGSWSLSEEVDGGGSFYFDVSSVLSTGLVGGHVMVVEGYGRDDWALVVMVATPTPTPTPVPTPTPTPEPFDISLDPVCGPVGDNVVTVFGYDWPGTDVRIDHTFGVTTTPLITLTWDAHETIFTIGVLTITNAITGPHTIQSYEHVGDDWVAQDREVFTVPCPPGPGYPNLVVQSVTVSPTEPISTYVPITFTVAIANSGATTATHLSWVDLYVDPAEPISPTNPSLPSGEDHTAIGPLGAGESTSVVLGLPEGLGASRTYTVFVMADTWHQVSESDEVDNLYEPVTMTIVAWPGNPATPTPALPVGTGSVSGSTWLYLDGDLAPQGRVLISMYTGAGVLVARGYSDPSGQYLFENVPRGTYNMFGQMVVDGELYLDILTNVEVKNNKLTRYQTLLLH